MSENVSIVDTLMEDLGMNDNLEDSNTELSSDQSDNTDLNSEQDDNPTVEHKSELTNEKTVDTEQQSMLEGLQKQIEGMEQRMEDKDKYIDELRSKSKETESEENDTEDVEEEDFWSNPEDTIKKLQDSMKMQDLRLNEAVFASTVNDYWKTVNPDALKEAVATDTDFLKEFNGSKEPYKTAYEYLINKTKTKETSASKLREEIKAELIKEMGIKKEHTEVPPSLNNSGSSSGSSSSNNADDGFMSVFGNQY